MCPFCKSKDTVFSGNGYRCRKCGRVYGLPLDNTVTCPSSDVSPSPMIFSDPAPFYDYSPSFSSYDSGSYSSCDCSCSCD